MSDEAQNEARALAPLIGTWSQEAIFPGAPPSDIRGRTVFEWMTGERFVVQRWATPHPAAPDGLAVLGYDEGRGTYLQHYFDERGVARVYEMTIGDGTWTLLRRQPDFSPFTFHQRFHGAFADGGARIDGRWESSGDGEAWQLDFELIYRRLDG